MSVQPLRPDLLRPDISIRTFCRCTVMSYHHSYVTSQIKSLNRKGSKFKGTFSRDGDLFRRCVLIFFRNFYLIIVVKSC